MIWVGSSKRGPQDVTGARSLDSVLGLRKSIPDSKVNALVPLGREAQPMLS